MSDTSPQDFTGPESNNLVTDPAGVPVGSGDGVQPSQEPENPFLANIPAEDKEVVAKYIKQWDANVTRRFQEIHGQYKPYKDLGDVETLSKAQQLYTYLQDQNNLKGFYERLHGTFGQQQDQQPNGQGLGDTDDPILQAMEQRFSHLQSELQQRDQILNAVAQHIIQQNQGQVQQQEDQQLEQYLGALKTEFGDFDEEFVLVKMSAGVNGAEAVQQWKQKVQQTVNQNSTQLPRQPVLSGAGGSPPQGRKPVDLTSAETKALVASVLEQANTQ